MADEEVPAEEIAEEVEEEVAEMNVLDALKEVCFIFVFDRSWLCGSNFVLRSFFVRGCFCQFLCRLVFLRPHSHGFRHQWQTSSRLLWAVGVRFPFTGGNAGENASGDEIPRPWVLVPLISPGATCTGTQLCGGWAAPHRL